VFARAVAFPFVNWDDPAHFLQSPLWEHPLVHGWRGLLETHEIGYPAPLLLLSFALDRALFGPTPAAFHAENVALHIAVVALVYRVACRVGLSERASAAAALLFSIHPLVVEPACWVTGRKDVLASTLLFSASLLACGDSKSEEMPPAWKWVVVNLLAVAAMLILPRMVVAPVLIALVACAARPGWNPMKVGARVLPGLIGTLGIAWFGARVLTSLGGVFVRAPGQIVRDVIGAWGLQVWHVLWPVDLLAYYYNLPGDPSRASIIGAFALVPLVIFLVFRFTPARSVERFGLAFFAVAYLPASSLFGNKRWTADSYMYLPLVGLSIAAVAAVTRAWPERLSAFGRGAWGVLVAILALISFTGTSRWSASSNVWAGVAERYPTQPQAYEQQAMGLLFDGRQAEAFQMFIDLAEKFPEWDDNYEHQYVAYEAKGDHPRALERLARCLRADSSFLCARLYWERLLKTPSPPGTSERDLVARSFEVVFPSMKKNSRDPALFHGVAAILSTVGLSDLASEAESHAAMLARSAQP
jgi:tetratricopeptide (TPR) repeat protein